MNANEVLANRAAEILNAPKGRIRQGPSERPCEHGAVDQRRVSPPPHGWRCCWAIRASWTARGHCRPRWTPRAREFAGVLKVGRTHLQDAVPITLGQEFGGYAACIAQGADDVEHASRQLLELNLGATAVGTGINTTAGYSGAAVNFLREYTGLDLKPARNLFRVTQSMGDVAGVFRRDAAAVDRAGKSGERPAAAEHGAARRHRRRSRCRPCSRGRPSCRAK